MSKSIKGITVINASSFFIILGRHFLLYSALTLLILLFAVNASAENEVPAEDIKRELNVVFLKDHHPISFELPDGRPAGLYIDVWNLWSITTGTHVNFIVDSYEEGLRQVRLKNAVHSGLFKNEARQNWADFSTPIHRVESSILYHKKGNKKRNLKQFDGMKVAVESGAYHERYILDNYPNITIVPYQGESSIHALISNDIQAVFNESPALNSLLAKMGLAGVLESNIVEDMSNLVHAVVAKGQPLLLQEINRGFENIPIEALVSLEKKWLPNTTPFFDSKSSFGMLTLSERNWLQAHSFFTLAIDPNSHPFEFIDKNNSHSGISADYIDFISQKLKINLNVVEGMTWGESFEQLKDGEIDVMSSMVRTAKREKSMLFTKPYFKFSSVMVTKKGAFYAESMNSFDDKKVGIVSGYVYAELLSKDYPNIKIVDVSSPEEGLQLVNDSELDAYMDSLAVANHFMDKNNYFDLIVASFTPYKVEMSMAVRLGLEPLIPILNKALDSMDAKKKSTIANNWLAVHIQEGTQLKTILKWIIPILTLLFIIIFIFIRINKKLTKEIEQRKLLEGKLLQSKKMEALGEMAGGIAHDFNNIMGIIMGNSEILSMKFEKDDTRQKFNINIYNACMRATELVRQIMTFSRMSKVPLLPVNLSDVVHECVQLIKSTCPKNIKILLDIEFGYDYFVKGDKTQINQVLINLCTNAVDAMSSNGGILELKLYCSNIQVPKGHDASNEYFSLNVKDSGCGIDNTIINNIFDPFFSTKSVGKGTGLGLSVVYNIITGHNGDISVVNNKGSGVEFTILLPKTLDAPLSEKAELSNEHVGQGNILIAEDEEDLRILYREHLESAGYVVTTAENGSEALALFKGNPQGYDLLLTDHSMPVMTGIELIEAVSKINVNIPIILATGYADMETIDQMASKHSYKCLVKPIKKNVLQETVYRCIDE